MTITEDGVFAHLPSEMERPADVAEDGRAGITQPTYDRLRASTLLELEVRCSMAEVAQEHLDHALLQEAAEMQLAARILRRLRSYQEMADSLFADSNIKLRLFFEGVAGVSEGAGLELVIMDEDRYDASEHYTPDPDDMVYSFYLREQGE